MGRGAMRVAIYARVSTADQNPELQLRELRDYAERRGFPVHREYVDQASGDVRRRRRAPAFDELMADARRRRFDCVLVWKYDRFARSLGALVAALQEFHDLGVDSTASRSRAGCARRCSPSTGWSSTTPSWTRACCTRTRTAARRW